MKTRDYIITQLLRLSGQRAGPIINARVNDFQHDLAKIRQHKTSARHGWARLLAGGELKQQVGSYMLPRENFLRDIIQSPRESMFLTKDGNRKRSNTLCKGLTRALGVKASATTMRMSTILLQKKWAIQIQKGLN